MSHVQCHKSSHLLQTHYSQNTGQEQEDVGRESLTTPSWLICFFPTYVYTGAGKEVGRTRPT